MTADICSPEWWWAYHLRVAGKELPAPGVATQTAIDGWLTADAEAGHCSLMCLGYGEDRNEVDDPEDPQWHHEQCGMNFKELS